MDITCRFEGQAGVWGKFFRKVLLRGFDLEIENESNNRVA
jgi:hypothetical protein